MVLCSSIPLQKFYLLQAVHVILKCPLNNFFWMTPYHSNLPFRYLVKMLAPKVDNQSKTQEVCEDFPEVYNVFSDVCEVFAISEVFLMTKICRVYVRSLIALWFLFSD